MNIESDVQNYIESAVASDEKICVPVRSEESDKRYEIPKNIKNATHYLIINFNDKTSLLLDRKGVGDIFQYSTRNGFKAIGLSSIICDNLSVMALKILRDAGISIWKPQEDSIVKNLKMFVKNELSAYVISNAKQITSCSDTCSRCGSKCN